MLLAVVAVIGCQPTDAAAPESTAPPVKNDAPSTSADGTFASVQPVLAKCTGCHGAQPKEGVDLRTHDSILKGGEHGPIVVAGDPEASLLIDVLRARNGKKQMPPGSPLPEDQIAAVEAWVKAGATG
jgi:mono/diheme cytochrome c family protein